MSFIFGVCFEADLACEGIVLSEYFWLAEEQLATCGMRDNTMS
jgi:hypothetical protein